ncbi:hypothetical protein LEP1GSC017_1116 [Leptospira meyeri serovar Hardjo str. Went 5]|nr:hypothetical protein LEP1GSC017_1116 [Leptospira meyeri serovar Hardjo str. Went 5]
MQTFGFQTTVMSSFEYFLIISLSIFILRIEFRRIFFSDRQSIV